MKRALITGATSGIGMQMALYLHRNGWELVLSGRNEKVLRRMADKFGRNTKYIALDLADRDAPARRSESEGYLRYSRQARYSYARF